MTPDDWQEDVLEGWLGRRRDGRWASATCGLAVPRQNGKNGVIEVRELFGMVELGERFLHTAHEVKTARKAFLRIASFFENERQFPELAALVREIRKTNGQEAVVLTNGGSVEFIARSRGSGRGFTVDVLVCDEAQDLTDEELAALLPTISAAPSGNPQVILTGTPPKPVEDGGSAEKGEVFRRVRADGESGSDPRLCWSDFGVKDGPQPDVLDRELWAQVNPALGTRLAVGEVERELKLMAPAKFAAERLGWWGNPAAGGGLVDMELWAGCRVDAAPVSGPVVLSWETTTDRATSCVVVTGTRADGAPQVEVVDVRPGTAWVPGRVAEIVARNEDIEAVVADEKSPAGPLIDDVDDALEAVGSWVRVSRAGFSDMAAASAQMFDAVRDGTVTHTGHGSLTADVAVAEKRPARDVWVWLRRGPLVAASLSLWKWRELAGAEYAIEDSFG